ncbi:hypothetical protein TCAL_16073, partial [Tigriopus californicus]
MNFAAVLTVLIVGVDFECLGCTIVNHKLPSRPKLSYFHKAWHFYEYPCECEMGPIDYSSLQFRVRDIHARIMPRDLLYESVNQSFVATYLGFDLHNMTMAQHLLAAFFDLELALFRIRNIAPNGECSNVPFLVQNGVLHQELESTLTSVQNGIQSHLCQNEDIYQLNSLEELKNRQVKTSYPCSAIELLTHRNLDYVVYVLGLIEEDIQGEEMSV